MKKIRTIALLIGPICFGIFYLFQPLEASLSINRMIGILLWIAIWWFSECVHLAVTALLPIVLIPLSQIANVKEVSKEYSDSIIFLFLGGFLISIAIEKWNLHKRIARNILRITGNSTQGILLGVMLACFLLSNWISNTATALMILGSVLALIKEFDFSINDNDKSLFAQALLLGMAYAASIGGMATPVGTPPNMYFFKMYPKLLDENVQITFFQWITSFFPLSFIILIGCFFILKILFLNKMNIKNIPNKNFEWYKKTKMSYEEKIILIVFLITIGLWLTRENINFGSITIKGWKNLFSHSEYIDDAVVAMSSAISLFVIPSKKNKNEALLVWEDIKQLKYELLLLFGGGFALAYGFEKSGLIEYLIQSFHFIQVIHPLILIALIGIVIVLISEFASNMATIQLALPLIIAMTSHLPAMYTNKLIFSSVLFASSGFMLPVATAPNMIAFGSGYIPMYSMLKAGFWLDVFCIFTITIYCYFFI